MAEGDHSSISILLPAAKIAVFSQDSKTIESAQNLSEDWRFARVKTDIQQGDVSAATSHYQSNPAPDLLIIQTENIDDGFTDKLGALSEYCDENTAAIVIGPVNDVNLYRKLTQLGISDYLVKPVETQELADVIAKTLIERLGVTESRLIAFIGSKGGVGTSLLTEAFGWALDEFAGQKCVIVDASGGWSTYSVGFGFEPTTTLAEASKAAAEGDDDSLKRMMFQPSEKLNVLGSGGDVLLEQPLTAEQLEKLTNSLMMKYPVVLVDLSKAAPDLAKEILTRANDIFLCTTPSLPALRLARALMQEIKQIRGGYIENIRLIVNMQGMASAYEVPKKDIEEAIDYKISSLIPFNPKVFIGPESEGKKLVESAEGESLIKAAFLPIIQEILSIEGDNSIEGSGSKKGSFLGGLLKK